MDGGIDVSCPSPNQGASQDPPMYSSGIYLKIFFGVGGLKNVMIAYIFRALLKHYNEPYSSHIASLINLRRKCRNADFEQYLPDFNQNVDFLRAPSDLVYEWSGIESVPPPYFALLK